MLLAPAEFKPRICLIEHPDYRTEAESPESLNDDH